jgi:hypothetical protein
MVANLALPRSAWDAHPHFPAQTLLLRSHQSFRSESRRLIARADSGAGRSAVLPSFSWWKSAMRSHEHYEESKLYPYLTHRWGLDCGPLTTGHHALATADAAVRASDGPDLVLALEAHHEVLMEHLDAEERLVIPALLALTPSEFAEYCDHPLWWLEREHPRHTP